jgi:hypothetical protein
MEIKRAVVRGVACIALGPVAGGLLPSVANAAPATVTPFTFTSIETFDDSPPECMPVLKSGVTNATETGTGRVIETANGFTVEFSDTFSYRTDFPDGSFLTGEAHAHQVSTGTGAVTTSTNASNEPRTIFSAAGTPIGQVRLHAVTHTTTNNLTGETTASVDKFFFTCF